MIHSSDILDRLNRAEALFPVDTWKVAGVDAWPLLRIRYGFELIEAGATTRYSGATQSGFSRAARAFSGPLLRLLARTQDYTRNANPTAPANVVFLSDGISYAMVGGLWMEKFCDPIIRELDRMQIRSLLLSPLHAYRVPRNSPSDFIQCELDRIAIAALAVPSLPDLPAFAEFQAWTQAAGGPTITLGWLRRACMRVRRLSEYFGRRLRQTGSALGFVVNYYSPMGMAFVLACRQLGIPVVDLQHGVAGDMHFAYGRWQRVPRAGFQLLPTHFWCWQQEDAAAIQRWAAGRGYRSIVGSNPWLEEWSNDGSQWAQETDERISLIKQQHPGAIHALVTLQSRIGTDQTPQTLDVIKAAGREVFWWVRLHPADMAERRSVAQLLGNLPAEIDLATDLPLPALLRQVDVHVTHSSSSVLEAAAMGIPSVITSTYGAELYTAQMRGGLAVHLNGGRLSECIRQVTSRRNTRTQQQHGQFLQAIEELIHTAGLRSPAEVVLPR